MFVTGRKSASPRQPSPQIQVPSSSSNQNQQQQFRQFIGGGSSNNNSRRNSSSASPSGQQHQQTHHNVEFHDVVKIVPAAPSFLEERLALLRHLKEVPPQVTHSTSMEDSLNLAASLRGGGGFGSLPASPTKTIRPGAGSPNATFTNARGKLVSSMSLGDDEPLFPLLAKNSDVQLIKLQLQESETRNDLFQNNFHSSFIDLLRQFYSEKSGIEKKESSRRAENNSRRMLLDVLAGGGAGSSKKNNSDSKNNAMNSSSTISIEELVKAIEKAHFNRLQDTMRLLDKMANDLKGSRSREADLAEQLEELKVYHIDTINYMKQQHEIEKDLILKKSEEKLIHRVRKMAKRVKSQDQEIMNALRDLDETTSPDERATTATTSKREEERRRSSSIPNNYRSASTASSSVVHHHQYENDNATVNVLRDAELLALRVLEQAIISGKRASSDSRSASAAAAQIVVPFITSASSKPPLSNKTVLVSPSRERSPEQQQQQQQLVHHDEHSPSPSGRFRGTTIPQQNNNTTFTTVSANSDLTDTSDEDDNVK